MQAVEVFLVVIAAYLLLGFVFAMWWVGAGAGRLDKLARATPLRARAIFLPGAVLLWPLLIAKLACPSPGAREGET